MSSVFNHLEMHAARLDACHIRDGRLPLVYEVAQIERFTLDDDGSLEGVADGKLRVLTWRMMKWLPP